MQAAKASAGLTEGPILKKMILYSLPVVGVNLLQVLFNTTNIMVLGWFGGDSAVAAVGSTTSLINLIIGFFVGLSLGANVLIARCAGSGDSERAKRLVGASTLLSIVAGVILIVIGVLGARTFLVWMHSEAEIIDRATLYLRVYFLGMPIIMFYNFSAAILRAAGDTMRPLIFLIVGGVLNIPLSIFFLTVLKMGVAGVAVSTLLTRGFSSVCCLVTLLKSKGYGRLEFKFIRFYKKEIAAILYIGVPSGIQKVLFSISNVMVQSTINTYGTAAVAANTVASQFDGLVYEVGEGFAISSLSFASQNYGAKRFDRIKKSMLIALALITLSAFSAGMLVVLFSNPLCQIVTQDQNVIGLAKIRHSILASAYFICGIQSCLAYGLRALGKSLTSMIITLLGILVLRIIWMKFIYVLNPSLQMAYLTYPVSWVITSAILAVVFIVTLKRAKRRESI